MLDAMMKKLDNGLYKYFQAISDIVNRGKLPVVVGGTNFYLEWLLYGVNNPCNASQNLLTSN